MADRRFPAPDVGFGCQVVCEQGMAGGPGGRAVHGQIVNAFLHSLHAEAGLDGSAPGPAKTEYGNNWVVAAVVVRLTALGRPVAIAVLAKLVIKGTSPR
jgi:hypothetical protein